MSFSDIGRTNNIITYLETNIAIVIPTATIIQTWRLQGYNFNLFTNKLVTIRVKPSKETPLNFGMKITNNHNGTYYLYSVTLRIIAKNDNDELEGKTTCDLANDLVKYFRKNQQDLTNGVLSVYDITARESVPINGNLSSTIVDMKILAERPLWE